MAAPKMLAGKKLIIFDWNDVFTLGSTRGYYACYKQALRKVNINLGYEEEDRRIREKWGAGHEAQIRFLLMEKPELVGRAVQEYEKAFFGDLFVDNLTLVDGAVELLTKLSQEYKLAVATGSHPKILKDRVFAKFGIPDVFCEVLTIFDIDDIKHAKPDPYMVVEILRRQNVDPEDAVVVGDAENDVRMAQSAGVEPIVVLTGHLDEERARSLGVRHIINTVADLC